MAKSAGDAGGTPGRRAWEATNMLTVAWAVASSAEERTESRGCHRRTDFVDPREIWLRHLTVRLDGAGAPRVHGAPED